MTISSASRRSTVYAGNGSTTVFSFAFKMFAAADVRVDTTDSAGVTTTLTYATQYTVTLNANQETNPGGSVTILTAPASGTQLRVLDATPATQPVDLAFADGFAPESVEGALDRATAIAARALENVTQAVSVPNTESGIVLPAIAQRASKYLTFDAAGLPTAAAAPAGTTAVSVFAATMLDDTSAEAVRRTILVQQDARLIAAGTGSIALADHGRHILVNQTSTVALNVDSLVNGWWVDITNTSAAGIVTLDPDGAALVGLLAGASTFRLYPGESARLRYDGDSLYRPLGLSRDIQLQDTNFNAVTFQAFTLGLNVADFQDVEVSFHELNTSLTTGVYIQVSVDGGSSWVTSGYQHARNGGTSGGANFAAGSTSDTAVALSTSVATTSLVSGHFRLFGPALRQISGQAGFSNSYSSEIFDGFSTTGSTVNGVRLVPGSGTLTGRVWVRGRRAKF